MSWLNVARLSDLAPDYPTACSVEGHRIALYLVDGAVYATSNICTHQFALLSDGYHEDGVVECPLHQGRFDIVSGKPLSPPVCVKLKTYPVRVDGRSVLIGLPAAGAIDAAKGAT